MHFHPSLAILTAVTLSFANLVLSTAPKIITPCPNDTRSKPIPVTITSQYQPVPTCIPKIACIKGKCSTQFVHTSYLYVSTVVPHAWNGTTSCYTTITDVEQPYRASEYYEVLTTVTAAPALPPKISKGPLEISGERLRSITRYETITRRAIAPYNAVGPLAMPGWSGSGLCDTCGNSTEGHRSQLLDVIECRYSSKSGRRHQKCFGWFEKWEDFNFPSSAITTSFVCSTEGIVTKPGFYTWKFTQKSDPLAVTMPVQDLTTINNGRTQVTVPPPKTYNIQAKPWTTHIINSFTGPTYYRFTTRVTETIIYTLPPQTHSASRSVFTTP